MERPKQTSNHHRRLSSSIDLVIQSKDNCAFNMTDTFIYTIIMQYNIIHIFVEVFDDGWQLPNKCSSLRFFENLAKPPDVHQKYLLINHAQEEDRLVNHAFSLVVASPHIKKVKSSLLGIVSFCSSLISARLSATMPPPRSPPRLKCTNAMCTFLASKDAEKMGSFCCKRCHLHHCSSPVGEVWMVGVRGVRPRQGVLDGVGYFFGIASRCSNLRKTKSLKRMAGAGYSRL